MTSHETSAVITRNRPSMLNQWLVIMTSRGRLRGSVVSVTAQTLGVRYGSRSRRVVKVALFQTRTRLDRCLRPGEFAGVKGC